MSVSWQNLYFAFFSRFSTSGISFALHTDNQILTGGIMFKKLLLITITLLFAGTLSAQHYLGVSTETCGTCHSAIIATWDSTGHADAQAGGEANAHFGYDCLPCHNTGWDTETVNGGFDEYVDSTGVYPGFVIKATAADTAGYERMKDVQCEHCHGAVGNSDGSAVDMSHASRATDFTAEGCGSCHQGEHHPYVEEWAESAHAEGIPAWFTRENNGSCYHCHAAQDFVAWKTDGGYDGTTFVPQGGTDDVITCATCHDPHGNENAGNLRFAEEEGHIVCDDCHNAHLDGEVDYTSTPHHTTSECLDGSDLFGWQYEGDYGTYANSPHTSVAEDRCADCHVHMEPFDGVSANTGHTFEPTVESCAVAACHGENYYSLVDTSNHMSKFDLYGAQTKINGLMDSLETILTNASSADSTLDAFDKALYNLNATKAEGSIGIHNTKLDEKLLMDAITDYNRATTDYVGEAKCLTCHSGMHADLVANYKASGHPYKLNPVNGAAPVYPAGTTPGVTETPDGTTWDDFAYVIGGYGWKARFVKKDGNVFTVNDSAQYNLWAENDDERWVAYHLGETKPYNYGCFQCHTTGATDSQDSSWVPGADLGFFEEPGVRCEGCHGPGAAHVDASGGVNLPITGLDLTLNRCAECHQRGGFSNAIPASSGYIKHHEQSNEMSASKHLDGNGPDLTCASCHASHVPLQYPDAAVTGTVAITTNCDDCHSGKEIALPGGGNKDIACTDCHMPKASKSALGHARGNGWEGDINTHIMAINTNPVVKDSVGAGMFTDDGTAVRLDENGLAAVTLDFACLSCHTDKDVDWAAPYAENMHDKTLAIEDVDGTLPREFSLEQNYPNPFNPTTTIVFNIPKTAEVKISLYTVDGRLVGHIFENRTMPAGKHLVDFDASNLSSGVYFYHMDAGSFKATKKMLLIK